MNIAEFDQHAVNHSVVALRQEMSPHGCTRQTEGDTVFMGGPALSDLDQNALARFGFDKNYQIIFPSFGGPVANGPSTLQVVVTDGETQAFVMSRGRLWKANRRSPTVIAFPDVGAVVRLTAKGNLAIREAKGRFQEQGFALALESLAARAARQPAKIPTTFPLGNVVAVLDIEAMLGSFEVAA